MRTVSSLFQSIFIFKVLCVATLALFFTVMQVQVTQAASTYSTGGSDYVDPCDTSNSSTYASAVSRPSYCTNHGSGDYSTGVTSYGSGYSYYEDYSDSDTSSESGKTAIKSEIESLLDRIKALNNQIKTGVPNNNTESGKTNDNTKPGKTNNNTEVPKACIIPTKTLSIGSKGTDVEQLQNNLKRIGYFSGGATGYFGEQTREAVRSFQKSKGIVSSGDERSTGYGMVGEKTRGMFKRECEGDKKDATNSSTAAYTLADVVSIIGKSVDPIPNAIDDEYTLYVVTLKDGSKREFKRGFGPRGQLEDRVKQTGYTGDIAQLLAKATTATATTPEKPKRFTLEDIATITAKTVGQKAGGANDEYTQYTVTLKSGAIFEVTGHTGRGTAKNFLRPFKNAGYTGSLDPLMEKVTTPSVLGAATIDTNTLLVAFITEVDELLKKLE